MCRNQLSSCWFIARFFCNLSEIEYLAIFFNVKHFNFEKYLSYICICRESSIKIQIVILPSTWSVYYISNICLWIISTTYISSIFFFLEKIYDCIIGLYNWIFYINVLNENLLRTKTWYDDIFVLVLSFPYRIIFHSCI